MFHPSVDCQECYCFDSLPPNGKKMLNVTLKAPQVKVFQIESEANFKKVQMHIVNEKAQVVLRPHRLKCYLRGNIRETGEK